MWRPPAKRDLSDDAKANIARIEAMWTDARTRFGAGGPFLFGRFSAADAMYAPIVSRFETYAVDVERAGRRLHAGDDRAAGVGRSGAAPRCSETWVIPKFEYDWPDVKRLAGGRRMKLVIGNKNYSSWSMRPWIAMKALGIPFEEILDPVRLADRQCGLQGSGSPPTRRPAACRCWSTATRQVWETLAILEYLAEKFPDAAALAGRRQGARAQARVLASEMHAGFVGAARRMPDEHPPAGARARALRRRAGRTSRASRRCGATAARAMAARSCSANSAPPTRCMRRWSRGCTPTASRSAATRSATWKS